MHPLPPGPSAPPLVQSARFGFRPYELLAACAARWGDAFTLRLHARPPHVVFSRPDAIRAIFTAASDDLRAGEGNAHILPFVGPGSLLVLDGARHLDERRVVLPAFTGDHLGAYAATMRDVTTAAIARWPRGRPFRLHRALQAITFEVILRTVFGLSHAAKRDQVRALLAPFLARAGGVTAPLVLLVPALQRDLGAWSPMGFFRRRMREVDAIVDDEIRARRSGPPRDDDVLGLLVAARRADGAALTDAELHDELFTLLMTGHETTATALAWVFHRLLTTPDVLARVRAEGDGGYLDAVVGETLRLRPVFATVVRAVARPTRIAGWDLPAGVMAVASPYLTHRRADVWPDPESFHPDRFHGRRVDPYAYYPFGGGVRRCIGAAFATFEIRLVVAEVLARVDLALAGARDARPVGRNVSVAPAGGVPVVATDRCSAASTPTAG